MCLAILLRRGYSPSSRSCLANAIAYIRIHGLLENSIFLVIYDIIAHMILFMSAYDFLSFADLRAGCQPAHS